MEAIKKLSVAVRLTKRNGGEVALNARLDDLLSYLTAITVRKLHLLLDDELSPT